MRVPFSDKQQIQNNSATANKAPYCHYWALIPPMTSTESHDGNVTSISVNSAFEDISIYNRNSSSSPSTYMAMVLLYDREQLLQPFLEHQAKYYQEHMRKFLEDERMFEMNTMLVSEMTKYLDTTIVPYIGNPAPYDPMNYVSGHLESKVITFEFL